MCSGLRPSLEGSPSPPRLAWDVRPLWVSCTSAENANQNMTSCQDSRTMPSSRPWESKGKSVSNSPMPGSSQAVIQNGLWPPPWKGNIHLLLVPDTGWRTESCGPSSGCQLAWRSPVRLVYLPQLEKHLLGWLWFALAAGPAPRATSLIATSTGCSRPKSLSKSGKEVRL